MKLQELKEKLETKFGTTFDYQSVEMLSIQQIYSFLGEILKDNESNQLKAINYATSQMKMLADKFMDLFMMDTTFGTNCFKMKH